MIKLSSVARDQLAGMISAMEAAAECLQVGETEEAGEMLEEAAEHLEWFWIETGDANDLA